MERITKTYAYIVHVSMLRVSERNYPICEDCNLSGKDPVLRRTKATFKAKVK